MSKLGGSELGSHVTQLLSSDVSRDNTDKLYKEDAIRGRALHFVPVLTDRTNLLITHLNIKINILT